MRNNKVIMNGESRRCCGLSSGETKKGGKGRKDAAKLHRRWRTSWRRVLLEKLIVFLQIQGISRILCDPKIHNLFHNSPPPAPVSSQVSRVYALSFYRFKIHFNITLPYTPRSSKWSHSFRFSNQNPVCIFPVSHTCNTPRPSHPPLFNHPITLSERYKS